MRAITAGAGGAALLVAAFGAGLSPAGADDDAESDADAAVWNDQYATVDIETGGEASSGNNEASSFNGNLTVIGQGAIADTGFLSESRDEILAWFTSEGFADWMGVGGSIDTGFSIIPGSPVVLPVLGGSATNLISSIDNTATGLATVAAGAASVSNTTGVTLAQDFSGGGADATSDATSSGGDADSHADASVNNTQTAHVGVSSGGSASSGNNSARTANGNAVVIGQGASANTGAAVNGNASNGGGGGSVTGGTASNEVGSVTNTAQGEANVTTGAASVSNNTNVSVTQSNSSGGATASSTAEGGGEG